MTLRTLYARAAVAFLSSTLLGCHVHIDAPGTDPLPQRLDFPAGIAMDPGGRFLYVSNGNADLRFGGGTLQMIDTLRFDCALDAFFSLRANPPLPLDPACAGFPSADDVAVTRDANGNPTFGCVADPLDPQVVDCVDAPFILGNATVRVGNFAGTMRIRRDATNPQRRTIYLSVRGDPSVTWVNVDLDRVPAALPGVLDCFDDLPSVQRRTDGYDPTTNVTTVPPRCDKSHLVQTYICPDRFGCVQGENDIPSEPFNLLLDEGLRADGSSFARLLVGHLSAGNVTLINLPGSPVIADVSPPFFGANQAGQHGTFGIARRDDPVRPLYYVTSNLSAALSTFYIDESPGGGTIVPGPVFSVGAAFAGGTDEREIVFEPGGQRAFMTQNAPPSLAIIDTRTDTADSHGLPSNKVVNTVEICQGPSHMTLRQMEVAGPVGAAPNLRSLLYVACFTSNQVMIVDPDRPGVDETILVGRGPTELAFNYSGAEAAPADRLPTPLHRRAYLTDYGESSIAVIDLDPGSPTENRMIARIGIPVPPPAQ